MASVVNDLWESGTAIWPIEIYCEFSHSSHRSDHDRHQSASALRAVLIRPHQSILGGPPSRGNIHATFENSRRGKKGRVEGRLKKRPVVKTSSLRPDRQSGQAADLTELTNAFRELFRGVIPISPLHQAVREAARLEGWAPLSEDEHQTANRRKAGKSSGVSRGGRASIRRSIVALARSKLDPEYRRAPYSNAAIEALREQYDGLLTKTADDPDPVVAGMISALSPADREALKKSSDDTLTADLKKLRRGHGVKR